MSKFELDKINKKDPDRKKTIGEIELELRDQKPDPKGYSPHYLRGTDPGIVDGLNEAIERGPNPDLYDGKSDFFVIIDRKGEKLVPHAVRQYFYCRVTCPDPNYDQVVFRYRKKENKAELYWALPDRNTAFALLNNSVNVAPDEMAVLKDVMDFRDLTLAQKAIDANVELEKERDV